MICTFLPPLPHSGRRLNKEAFGHSLGMAECFWRSGRALELAGLAEKGVHEFELIENLQVFDPLSHPDIFHGNPELV